MGADMLIECFWEEINEKRLPVRKPNWQKGYARIKELCEKWKQTGIFPECSLLPIENGDLKQPLPTTENVNSILNTLNRYLGCVENAYRGGSRELTSLEFPPYRIHITGGMSYGDEPSELFSILSDLGSLEILEETGLNPALPDSTQILKKLVRNRDLRPLLIGQDKELDNMLDLEMRKPKRRTK
jgi:hypothetical protein